MTLAGAKGSRAHFFHLRRSDTILWQASTATATSPNQSPNMSLVTGEKSNFQFILRLLNTNVEGKQKVMYALTKIKGVGRRYSNLVCKKADVDLNKRYAIRNPAAVLQQRD